MVSITWYLGCLIEQLGNAGGVFGFWLVVLMPGPNLDSNTPMVFF